MTAVETMLARHEELKQHLIELYGENPIIFDPCNGGTLLPPHGMCETAMLLRIVDSIDQRLRAAKADIKRIKQALWKEYPYVPRPLNPNMRLSKTRTFKEGQERMRSDLYRELGKAISESMQAKEELDFWRRNVQPVTWSYLKEIQGMFQEKHDLRMALLSEHGLFAVSAW